MAEALLDVVLQNLSSFIRDELARFWGVKGEIQRLTNSLKLIQAVIVDAEQKEITKESIKIWLQQLKDAAHVLDDILDDYSIRSLPHNNSGSANQVHRFSLSSIKPKTIRFRYRIGKRLKEISQRLDQIAKERKNYDFVEREVIIRERPIQVPEWRQTSSIIAQPQVYGRDGDKDRIVEFLLRQAPESGGLSVYAIVGLGGLGKTTLAQLVYNDQRVSHHFTLRIWICVSDDFSVVRILQSIMVSITKEECNIKDLDPLQNIVQEKLQSKRYLLVLDDVWNKDQHQWNQLRSVLACGSKGASVLVTTRELGVASIMRTHHTYHLSSLSEDDCWSLFKQRAFPNIAEVSEELEEIGREIVSKCGGLPLAAQALGSLLQSNSDVKRWLEVKESELWNLQDEKSILPALRLSYFSLTPTLRRCFAFCAIFPKDKVIEKEELIHLWMANGFISSREKLEIEDVGNEIWNELYGKSLFQEVTTDDLGGIRFKMHDLVHDLAQSVAGKECFVMKDVDITNLSRSTHHIRYVGYGRTINKKDLKNVESLRTFLDMKSFLELDFWKFQVHSLGVLSTNSPKLPLLCYVIHLRYLALCYLKEYTIPTSICSLRKLEILKFQGYGSLLHLPEGLTNLQNLRHLIILGCVLSHMPPGIGKLSGLRTLSSFIVNPEEGHSLKELHGLNLCQRKLSIEGLEWVGRVDEAKGVNLIGIKELQVLSLSWGLFRRVGVDVEQVIEALQPPSNLKKLEVSGYKGSHFPSWMKNVSCLNNLVNLKLEYCRNCVQLPALGKLPSLKNLEILGMECVEYMDDDESYDGVEVKAFISLKTLYLLEMPKLERLLKREGGEMFPRLHRLDITYCPELTLPCLPSLEDLSIMNRGEKIIMRGPKLFIKGCPKLPTQLNSLRGLKSLHIESCSMLPTQLNSLRGLKSLHIERCSMLPTQFKSLDALETLTLLSCNEVEYIPEQMLEGLGSLRTLEIYMCEALKCLPEAIQNLTSLADLKIRRCPILEERSKEGSGEDWHKIQHIPNVYISSYEWI